MSHHAILRVSCPDRTGLVAALSDFVFRHGGNILDLDQHTEPEGGRFFMRLEWGTDGFRLDADGVRLAMQSLAQSYGLHWELDFTDTLDRIAVFCSREPHCLYDLLVRQQMRELPGDIVLVVGNHEGGKAVADSFGVPWEFVPVPAGGKGAAEAAQNQLLERHHIDLVVLARYMQILSGDFTRRWAGRIINIHHSVLPAFAGARPYHQARQRGVKLIGATAHYATEDLDDGPIIEQDVARVTHRDPVAELVRQGRDLERRVLARAVRLHLQRRVLVEGNRTIIFE